MRSSFASSAALCATCFAIAACGSSDEDDEDPKTQPTLDFAAFARELDAFVQETDGVDGAGAIVVHRDLGVVYRGAFGAFSEDRVYLVASASKIVTVGIAMKLMDAGLLDIEKPMIESNFANGDLARQRTQPLLEAAFDQGQR